MTRKPLHELTPSQALRERFDLEAEFASAGSPTGHHLRAIESRALGPGHNGASAEPEEDRQIRLMDLMNLTKTLTPAEIEVARLRWRELARPTTYERLRRPADIRAGDGETVVDHKPKGDDGEPIEGFVLVVGPSSRPASDREVGDRLGCSAYQVKQVVGAALHKVKLAQAKIDPAELDAEA